MFFNPLFMQSISETGIQTANTNNKLGNSKYLFSDIIKVFNESDPTTASAVLPESTSVSSAPEIFSFQSPDMSSGIKYQDKKGVEGNKDQSIFELISSILLANTTPVESLQKENGLQKLPDAISDGTSVLSPDSKEFVVQSESLSNLLTQILSAAQTTKFSATKEMLSTESLPGEESNLEGIISDLMKKLVTDGEAVIQLENAGQNIQFKISKIDETNNGNSNTDAAIAAQLPTTGSITDVVNPINVTTKTNEPDQTSLKEVVKGTPNEAGVMGETAKQKGLKKAGSAARKVKSNPEQIKNSPSKPVMQSRNIDSEIDKLILQATESEVGQPLVDANETTPNSKFNVAALPVSGEKLTVIDSEVSETTPEIKSTATPIQLPQVETKSNNVASSSNNFTETSAQPVAEVLKEGTESIASELRLSKSEIPLDKAEIQSGKIAADSSTPEVPMNKIEVEISKAETQLNKTAINADKTEIQSGDIKVQSNKTEVQASKTEVIYNKSEVQSNKPEVQSGKAVTQPSETEIPSNNVEAQTNNTEVKASKTEIASTKIEVQPNKPEVQSGKAVAQPSETEIPSNKVEAQTNNTEVKASKTEIASIKTELQSDKPEVQSGKAVAQPSETEIPSNKVEEQTNNTEVKASKTEIASNKTELQPDKSEAQASKSAMQSEKAENPSAKVELQQSGLEAKASKTEVSLNKVEAQSNTPEVQANKPEVQSGKTEIQSGETKIPLNKVETKPNKSEGQASKAEAQPSKIEVQIDRNYDKLTKSEAKSIKTAQLSVTSDLKADSQQFPVDGEKVTSESQINKVVNSKLNLNSERLIHALEVNSLTTTSAKNLSGYKIVMQVSEKEAQQTSAKNVNNSEVIKTDTTPRAPQIIFSKEVMTDEIKNLAANQSVTSSKADAKINFSKQPFPQNLFVNSDYTADVQKLNISGDQNKVEAADINLLNRLALTNTKLAAVSKPDSDVKVADNPLEKVSTPLLKQVVAETKHATPDQGEINTSNELISKTTENSISNKPVSVEVRKEMVVQKLVDTPAQQGNDETKQTEQQVFNQSSKPVVKQAIETSNAAPVLNELLNVKSKPENESKKNSYEVQKVSAQNETEKPVVKTVMTNNEFGADTKGQQASSTEVNTAKEVKHEAAKSGSEVEETKPAETQQSVSTNHQAHEMKNSSPKEKIASTNFPLPETEKTIKSFELSKEISKIIESGTSQKVVLRLLPEALGKVKLTLEVGGEVIHAKAEVENESVRQIIQTNTEALKQTLSQNGLQLASFNVSLAGSDEKHQKAHGQKKRSNTFSNKSKIEKQVLPEATRTLGYNTYEYLA
ncbi:MAG: flagellar hook-length control protein FliK [Ignavibacteria bacterium]|nr:flagellar hook-length control protein FliK [Ignavibacteria bacterium]